MNGISSFFASAYGAVAAIPFDLLLTLTLGAFAAVFAVVLAGCLVSRKIKAADKRPFLHFVNAFTALALAVLLVGVPLERAVLFAAVFWFVGYLMYGVLCALTKPYARRGEMSGATVVSTLAPAPQKEKLYPSVPAAQNSVRLEHALSIADKLLLKNLGRGDRQELEKMKTTLTVLQIKGSLTPQEGEVLNENFNALLKLMAKYNL